MVTSQMVKNMLGDAGADLAGIASIDRFADAPRGFHPRDLYPDTESVIAFAKRFPGDTLLAKSAIPYTIANNFTLNQVFQLAIDLTLYLNDQGVKAAPVPSEPYEYWEADRMEGRGLISMRHAGYLAGLGVFGRNNLLYNQKYGNMIILGVVLANIALTPDPIAEYSFCAENCNLCIKNCPAQALDGTSVDQKRCRQVSQGFNKKGEFVYSCSKCRTICPNSSGLAKLNF